MKTNFIIIFTLIFCYEISAQTNNLPDRLKGIEIYLLKEKYQNKNSYQYFNKKKLKRLRKSIEKLSDIPDTVCNNYIDYRNVVLEIDAFLNRTDIDYYRWKDFTIVLKEKGLEKLNELAIDRIGIPFVIVVSNKPLLGGWFWNGSESTVCDRVYIIADRNSYEIKIGFTLCGKDPRNNNELMKELKLINE